MKTRATWREYNFAYINAAICPKIVAVEGLSTLTDPDARLFLTECDLTAFVNVLQSELYYIKFFHLVLFLFYFFFLHNISDGNFKYRFSRRLVRINCDSTVHGVWYLHQNDQTDQFVILR